MTLEARLRAVAEAADLAVGFCSADPFPEVEESLRDAVESGRSASLGFTFRDPATASDPRASFPWAESLVVVASTYLPEAGTPPQPAPGQGRIARFATEDHYVGLRAGLDALADLLSEAGHRAAALCDDNRLVDRAAAVRSGVGWWGKSTMVLAPGSGPWMLLGSVVTDATLAPTAPMRRDCGTCDACLPACPTGALIAPGVIDARLCLAAIAQSKGAIPRPLRSAMGDRFYGCDECLTACPPGQRLADTATTRRGEVDLVEVLSMADGPLRARYAHFFVPRNDARFLRRNALVALGNTGSTAHIPVLAGFVTDPDPLLRSHAAWALGRIGGAEAGTALAAASRRESDPGVLEEICAALGTLG